MWTKEQIPDQSGRTAIVTGANTGIGFETALALYEAGATVILACRSEARATEALQQIQERTKGGALLTATLDLSAQRSIQDFATRFMQEHTRLDLLINNAGVMMPPASQTAAGYELQFGVNFLGHFALTGYLYPLLRATPGARIVTLSSMAYLRGSIDFSNLRSEQSYDPMREYAQSKLADLIFSVALQHHIDAAADQVLSIAAQPGANKTELARHMQQEEYTAAVKRTGPLMDPWQGALPSLYAAVSGQAQGGRLYGPHEDGYRGYPAEATIAPHALDEALAQKLWTLAEEATGVHFPA